MAQTSRKTTQKKAPARSTASRSTTKSTSVVKQDSMQASENSTQASRRRAREQVAFRKSSLIIIVAILIVAALLYYFRSLFIVATVNGQPITRASYYAELEKQSGQQVLNTLVTKKLIAEEAAKKHVTVTNSEVNTQIATIEKNLKKQGQTLDGALTAQGLTRAGLSDQIYYQKLIEKMLGNTIKVTDAEVNSYIEKNKDSLPQNQSADELKTTVKQQLMQQKQNSAVQGWIASLQKNAKVDYLIKY